MSVALTPTGDGDEVQVASKEHARQLVDEIKQRGARLLKQAAELAVDKEDFGNLVGLAYRHRAWIPLGYESWEKLAETEFSEARFFDSLEARRDRVQALVAEGLSTRAVGVVLGIGKDTAHRDALATVADATVANPGPQAPSPRAVPTKVPGLDGKQRQRKRATPSEMADRVMIVAQRLAEGWTQAQIGESLGVDQRTISNDKQLIQGWKDELSTTEVKRLESGKLSRAELAESANLEIVERDRKRLEAGARNGAEALTEGLKFLSASVVYADAWLEERAETSAILAPSLANVAGEGAEWMALDFDYVDVPDEDLQLLHDDLGRASEWARQAQLRLANAAQERGVELDQERYRSEIERKVESRRGSQR